MKRFLPRGLGQAAALLALVTAVGALFLALVGIDALEGRSDFQFYADSNTYHDLARGMLPGVDGATDLITVAANFIGPLLVLRLTGENHYLVLLLNAVLMFASISSISKTVGLDALRLTLVLLANPLTISSLLSVNKEVISMVFIAMLLRALASRSTLWFLAAAGVSLLVRWQLTLVLVMLVGLVLPVPPIGHRRSVVFFGLLVALSVLYIALLPLLEPVRATFELSASEYEGSGFYEWLVGQQETGVYWAIFPLKAAHLLFGMGLRFDRLIAPTNIYNDVWQLLHSTTTLLMFLALWRAGRLRLSNDLVFISAIYIAVFALSPIYSPRYFYAVYILWAIALTAPAPMFRFARAAQRSRRSANSATPHTPGNPTDPLPESK
jgi:hypothetical protein